MQLVKKHTGLFCCLLALFVLINCSSHRTSSYRDTHALYPHLGSHHHFSNDARALGIYALILVAVAVVPPALEAIGEALDGVLIEIGLKERNAEYE